MFVVTTVYDVIRIPPYLLSAPTVQAIHSEIDLKYPNRVMDVGLVISRYGDCLEVGHGVCVAGDGGSHHQCKFRLIVFRPFVEEVCLGRITRSTVEGIHVSLGFFEDIFVPAYWMLRPSSFEERTGVWVWTPQYEDVEGTGAGEGGTSNPVNESKVKAEVGEKTTSSVNVGDVENRYEMPHGAQIRFKVKSINFTQVTDTAKGRQATTTTTAHSHNSMLGLSTGGSAVATVEDNNIPSPVSANTSHAENSPLLPVRRRRSSSVGIDETQDPPPAMHIVASICEDGLGLTSWWTGGDEDDEDGTTGKPEQV